ncbi:MAG TPA: hypothetical protein VGM82_11770 [Gemmatimonadaceae bacterium]|jgi:hypothetical protein
MNNRALMIATLVGIVVQVAMVMIGHTNPTVKTFFAIGGMGFSLIAGLLYGIIAGGGAIGSLAIGGAFAGGICAFIGILVSHLLGDVPATLLLLGTISSVVTGAIGGAVAKFFVR